MASNRHLGRIVALQTLYEQDFRRDVADPGFDLHEVMARNIARYEEVLEDTDFITRIVEGTTAKQEDLDAIIVPVAPEWPIDQIARMDRSLLRMSIYELMFDNDVPPKVVINEAVELAKAFGGENSSKFINGVLGTVLKNKQATAESAKKPATKKPTIKAAKPKKTPTAKKTIKE